MNQLTIVANGNQLYTIEEVYEIFDSAYPIRQKHLAEAIHKDWFHKASLNKRVAITQPSDLTENGYDVHDILLFDSVEQATQYMVEEEWI